MAFGFVYEEEGAFVTKMDENNIEMTEEYLRGVVATFRPLALSLAFKYAGNGAERDDLAQVLCLRISRLAPKCRDLESMAAFLLVSLPGIAKREAAKMKWRQGDLPLDDDDTDPDARELAIADEGALEPFEVFELDDMMRRVLTEEELRIVWLRYDGYSQAEIGRMLGISQQAAAKRMKKIERKLSALWPFI